MEDLPRMDFLEALPTILDLASNFNIDLSRFLTRFAQQLRDDVEFNEVFSFPRAALLVQQWALIYGRKVDYIYSLVLEFCEKLNGRLYAPETREEGSTTSPKKNTRKRKVPENVASEDFHLNNGFLEYSRSITKKKGHNKSHTSEHVCVRLQNTNFKSKSNEFHVYDDEFNNIGTKDQYRINWHLDNKCRLEEFIKDEGSGSLWNVCDVRVNNMPTPTYSDEGTAADILSGDLVDTHHGVDTCLDEDVHNEEPVVCSGNALADVPLIQDEYLSSQSCPVSHDIVLPEKAIISRKSVFKLPFELTRKGAKPELNFTQFLFSDMLRRNLKMEGTLPLSSGKNEDKKLILKHVSFLMNRFHLDQRRDSLNINSLLDPQTDFLGFEEEVLGNIPPVLTDTETHNQQLDKSTESAEEIGVNIIEDHFSDNNDVESSGIPPVDNVNVAVDQEGQPQVNNVIVSDPANRKTTLVSAEVTTWREFILGKLGDEKQSDFNIHKYGSSIISAFTNIGETISFGELCGGSDRREITKHFLSVLMLANAGNISIDNNGPNTLKLTLVSTEHLERVLQPSSTSSKQTQSKRKTCNDYEDGAPSDKRFRKQIPGKGPWKNKSRK